MDELFSLDLQYIHSKSIDVDEDGQRDVTDRSRERQFHWIVKNFDPYLVNPIKVGYIDKKYYCFDGQMTLRVLKEMNGGKDLIVPCLVYDIDLDKCADLFLKQNGKVVPVSIIDILNVRIKKGEKVDKGAETLEMYKIIQEYGYGLSKTTGPNAITAGGALNSAFENLGAYGFEKMIRILRQAWDGETDSIKGLMIGGMAMFINQYDGRFDEQKLISRLRKVSPVKILRDAHVRAPGKRGVAREILEVYNHQNSARLPDEL